MAENKTQPTQTSISAFVAAIADPVQRADAKTLIKMMSDATGKKAVVWGAAIVGCDRYHYHYDSGREGEMPVICFSPRKAGTVLYLAPPLKNYAALLKKLGKHKVSGSCLHIKKLADVDGQVLSHLIAKSVAARRSAG